MSDVSLARPLADEPKMMMKRNLSNLPGRHAEGCSVPHAHLFPDIPSAIASPIPE
jgi:hypothetical protein